MTSDEFTRKLLLEEKVTVVPGTMFGPSGKGYVRYCYTTSLPNIQEALKQMGEFSKLHRTK